MTTSRLSIRTTRAQELVDITEAVRTELDQISCAALLIYMPHTTAGLLINEHADPDVARDILVALDRMVPNGDLYRHSEGNSAAHVKACLVGSSVHVPVSDGRLALGRWQGIFLAEFDGPRVRTVLVTLLDKQE